MHILIELRDNNYLILLYLKNRTRKDFMEICIIIPMFNEAKRFEALSLSEYAKNNSLVFYLVNDGSTDGTEQIIEELSQKHPNILSLNLSKNMGKAETIRAAVLKIQDSNKFDYVGYFDADFATPLSEIQYFIEAIKATKKSFVMGMRIKRLGANIKRYKTRHYMGRIVASIISELILKIPVYDTQCGAKLIEFNLAKQLFEQPFKTKWLFDVELIARMKALYGKDSCLNNILELPLNTWIDKGNSKITFIDFLKTPFNLIKLMIYYR